MSQTPQSPPRRGAAYPTLFASLRITIGLLSYAGYSIAAPLTIQSPPEDGPSTPDDPTTWIYLSTAIALVLLGGAFAGLTIALMGQDEVYLQVIAESGEGSEKKNAVKVLNLLKRGKHWVLVTLLVGNVITNETLPIVLDRSIGGGYAAAISSTVLVIIFGEIVPQSICVRYGLPIGAWCANFVLLLMWIFAPITWPIAKLLDRLLGEDHGTVYKKAGLKTLVTLHQSLGHPGTERLNEDEVSIISGVLDLKAKPVGAIMTPMNDVFTLSSDAVLDEEMMDDIMREGYSRIPIHEPKYKSNFVGMLLVKMLITYDPEDARRVSDFALATLPETLPSTSCLDIINFFQEGKSHMVLVSDYPGESFGALGVVTLEDVIEELIGEEIIDESDVFVDVHKAIRRMAPAPTHKPRVQSRASYVEGERKEETSTDTQDDKDGNAEHRTKRPSVSSDYGKSPRTTTLLVRRRSSNASSPVSEQPRPQIQPRQYSVAQARQQLRSLGPSNAARQPKSTRVNTVKIKPGVGTIPEHSKLHVSHSPPKSPHVEHVGSLPNADVQGAAGETLVGPGKGASDGVKVVQAGYGSTGQTGSLLRPGLGDRPGTAPSNMNASETEDLIEQTPTQEAFPQMPQRPEQERTTSHDTIGSLQETSPVTRHARETARSGSISQNFVDSGGVKKLVLEMSSSSDEGMLEGGEANAGENNDRGEGGRSRRQSTSSQRTTWNEFSSRTNVQPGEIVEGGSSGVNGTGASVDQGGNSKAGRKNRRAKRRKKSSDEGLADGQNNENTPLLDRDTR